VTPNRRLEDAFLALIAGTASASQDSASQDSASQDGQDGRDGENAVTAEPEQAR
jgi:hypothetical protein